MTTKDRLYYHGTDLEVSLGDRVLVRRWLGRARKGTVCYLPGVSQPNPEMENDGEPYWAVELESGTRLVWPYVPSQLQPSKRIELLGRGDPSYRGLGPGQKVGLIPDPE